MEQEKDLCKTCKHYWQDFPLPLDHVVSHCEILDKKVSFKEMNDIVQFPCLECPFDSYSKKEMEQTTHTIRTAYRLIGDYNNNEVQLGDNIPTIESAEDRRQDYYARYPELDKIYIEEYHIFEF